MWSILPFEQRKRGGTRERRKKSHVNLVVLGVIRNVKTSQPRKKRKKKLRIYVYICVPFSGCALRAPSFVAYIPTYFVQR